MPEAGRGVTAYIGLGANLGDARAALTDALRRLAELPQTRLVVARLGAGHRVRALHALGG